MNIPHLTIVIALALWYLPRVLTAKGQAERPEGYDNSNPRDQQARLEGLAKRALAAHMNGLESFASFAPAVIAAEISGVEPRRIVTLAVTHVLARAVYVGLYLADLPLLRSLVWTIGFVATVMLFMASLG